MLNLYNVLIYAQALKKSVLYLLLAPYDHEQSDLLHRVYQEKKLEQLPTYKYVRVCVRVCGCVWVCACVHAVLAISVEGCSDIHVMLKCCQFNSGNATYMYLIIINYNFYRIFVSLHSITLTANL